MKKFCRTCKEEKELSQFHIKKRNSDGHQSKCKQCQSKYHRSWYINNSEEHKSNVTYRKKEILPDLKQKYYDYLSSHPCIDCGESEPACLEFDHMEKKKYNISTMIGGLYSWNSILEEIQKCVVRCANCHRKKTAKDFKWYKDVIKVR